MYFSSRWACGILAMFCMGCLGSSPGWTQTGSRTNLDEVRILVMENQGVLAKAAEMLSEEIEKRTGILPPIQSGVGSESGAAIHLLRVDQAPEGLDVSSVPAGPEGFSVWVSNPSDIAPRIYLVGRDDRGALYAVAGLLKLLFLSEGTIEIDPETRLSTAPKYLIRGHQLGYRNTANTYDAWDLDTYEQYLRDLILFGTNSIELITALDPEEFDGPVMTESQWDRNLKLAELVHSYGLDVWFWMPLDGDVTDPKVSRQELEARERFFQKVPAIDHIMVPGGDPGRTTPAVLMPWLEKMSEVLHRYFPKAGIWVSNQKFTFQENEVFFDYLEKNQPEWLRGVVYGPGTLISIQETRLRTPEKYPLRRYSDITHCVRCEFPVPEWDGVFAQTLDREPPNPRPSGMSYIHNLWAPFSDGFVTYSDGAHDDFNKMVWTSLAWDPDKKVRDILVDYGRLFFGQELGPEVAMGLEHLEKNWVGPVEDNRGIEATLAAWRSISEKGGATVRNNWRFQMYLFRAIFDRYIQVRYQREMSYQSTAYEALAGAREKGSSIAIEAARKALAQADVKRVHPDLRFELERLGIDLLESIGYQLSVREPYRARNPERGALLDKADRPLNDRPWLEERFEIILKMDQESDRLAAIDQILNWDDPGEGGFYDDLGNSTRQPHLVRQTTWMEDPMYVTGPQESHYRSMNNETLAIPPLKGSWLDQSETDYGVPLMLRYDNLDPQAHYRVRVTYFGRYNAPMRLVADGQFEIHGAMSISDPVWPVEFPVPKQATQDGQLQLVWELVEGRGCQVAEVWLLRTD